MCGNPLVVARSRSFWWKRWSRDVGSQALHTRLDVQSVAGESCKKSTILSISSGGSGCAMVFGEIDNQLAMTKHDSIMVWALSLSGNFRNEERPHTQFSTGYESGDIEGA